MSVDLKQQVRDFWNANPCGTKFSEKEIGTKEFFDSIKQHRYSTEWHIPQVVQFERWRGRNVLEIGCGLGTDAVEFARAGANYTGIDLTPRSIELVARRFEMLGLSGRLRVADAESLPFEAEEFDLVYSHGVLHHTPDPQKAFDEIHRVLKPGGTAMIMLYHKNSYNYYVNIMFLRRLGAQLLRFDWGPNLVNKITGEDIDRLNQLQMRLRQDPAKFFSKEEFLNQNTDGAGNPLARVFTRRQVEEMFSRFSTVETQVHFLNKRWIPVIGKILPRAIERPLAHRFGWHLWIIARKF